MSKEHIFVVKYTTDKGWEWDTDTEAAHFDNGTIYDTEKDSWEPAHLGDGEYIDNDDEVGERLSAILAIANQANQ